jgi:circadian clock protein KaiA
LYSPLSICLFIPQTAIAESVTRFLGGERYHLTILNSAQELRDFVLQHKEQIDCLIILSEPSCFSLVNDFYEQGIILPVVIIEEDDLSDDIFPSQHQSDFLDSDSLVREPPLHVYHAGEIKLRLRQLSDLTTFIDKAITQFLHLGPSCPLSDKPTSQHPPQPVEEKQNFFLLQQRRLAEKLKERLGYLGVYYNRNSRYFYRHLSQLEKRELLQEMKDEYRVIILDYFAKDSDVNQKIDNFVNRVFFTDLSVSQVLEIHMELMDEFAQQLKLEGRNEDILIDYRLALIDIIAHLCEMYRRSIPREDIPFDVLFPID